jgi:isoquinoline 1-oxidoreductase alpha subunit
MPLTLRINDRSIPIESAADTPLLWVLRDELGLTGTKFGCGMGLCGACTVHVAGRPVRTCVTPVAAAQGKPVTTIEGVEHDRIGRAVQSAWLALGVPQCGYCQAGQIMSAVALLRETSRPTDAEIDAAMAGNLCRCGTYPRIRAAIHAAARQLQEGA